MKNEYWQIADFPVVRYNSNVYLRYTHRTFRLENENLLTFDSEFCFRFLFYFLTQLIFSLMNL